MQKESSIERKRRNATWHYDPNAMGYVNYTVDLTPSDIKLYFTYKKDKARPGKIILTGLQLPAPKHIVIPKCVSVIQSLTTGKAGFKKVHPAIRSVYIGDGVEEIGENAFCGMELECVNMQEALSLKKIGKNAFADNKLRAPLSVPQGAQIDGDIGCPYQRCKQNYPTFEHLGWLDGPFLHDEEGDGLYLPFLVSNRTITYFPSYISRLGDMRLANYDDGLTIGCVRKIDAGAFKGTNVRRVCISKDSTLTEIESETFADCKLKELILPATVQKVADNALGDIRKMECVVADGWKDARKYFSDTVLVPSKEYWADVENRSLFSFESSGQVIAGFAQNLSKKPSEIVLPKGVKKIKPDAFAECKFLKRAVVGKDVTFEKTDDPMELRREHDSFPPCCEVVTPDGEVLQEALSEEEVERRRIVALYYKQRDSYRFSEERIATVTLRLYCEEHKNCKDFSEFSTQYKGRAMLRYFRSRCFDSFAMRHLTDDYFGIYNPNNPPSFKESKDMLACGDTFYYYFKAGKVPEYKYNGQVVRICSEPDYSPVLYCYKHVKIPKDRKIEITERICELEERLATIRADELDAVTRYEAWLNTAKGRACLDKEYQVYRSEQAALEAEDRRKHPEMYDSKGNFVPRIRETAVQLYERLAKEQEQTGGSDPGGSYYMLGREYMEGKSVPKDLRKAYEYFSKVDFRSKYSSAAYSCKLSIEKELAAEKAAADRAAEAARAAADQAEQAALKQLKAEQYKQSLLDEAQSHKPYVLLDAVEDQIRSACNKELGSIGVYIYTSPEYIKTIEVGDYTFSFWKAVFEVHAGGKQKDLEELGKKNGGGTNYHTQFIRSLEKQGINSADIWGVDKETKKSLSASARDNLTKLQVSDSMAQVRDSTSAWSAGRSVFRSTVRDIIKRCWDSNPDIILDKDKDNDYKIEKVTGWKVTYKFPDK